MPTGSHRHVTRVQQVSDPQTSAAEQDEVRPKKVTRPVGQPGGSMRHGVDEAPVPDAGSTIRAFSSENQSRIWIAGWGTGSRQESASNQAPLSRASVVAGAHAADVIAERVELANPAAAAITIVVVAVIGGDRAADDRGSDEACANAPAPAERLGLSLRGGGRDRAGNGERGKSESGNPGLDRHDKLHPVEAVPLWSACIFGRRLFDSGSNRTKVASAGCYCDGITIA